MLTVYTDGACSGNPGRGGWAWAVSPGSPNGAGNEDHTTNQRMELQAALEAILALDGDLTIVSDSMYVVQCFTDGWHVKWKANGWRKGKGPKARPVMNLDLWQPLVEHATSRNVTFRWVKGHSGDSMNDLVDRLAVAAAKNLSPILRRDLSGDILPSSAQQTLDLDGT